MPQLDHPPISLAPANDRSFASGEFRDTYGEACRIQESSNVVPHVWLGLAHNSMHVDQRRAGELGAMLVHFSFTGQLVEAKDVERYTIGVKMGGEPIEEWSFSKETYRSSDAPRKHTVKRGESWHGIAKRLTGDADPGSLLGRVQRLKELNAVHLAGPGATPSCPPEGAELTIPGEWPAKPVVDQASAAGAQRISLLAVDEMERLRKELSFDAERWRAITSMSGWKFIRWAWRYYWKGSIPLRFDPMEDETRG